MSEEWLATENFERAHKIITAINILSIHAKLTLAGVEDTTPLEEVTEARWQLESFLESFEHIVSKVEINQEATVMGVDPGLNMLAQQFVSAKQQWPRPMLYDISFYRLKQLISSDNHSDLYQLIECLRTLRSLVDQNAYLYKRT